MNKPASYKVLMALQDWLLARNPLPTKARIGEPLWSALKAEMYSTEESMSLWFDGRKNEDWIGNHVFGMDFEVDNSMPPDAIEILN